MVQSLRAREDSAFVASYSIVVPSDDRLPFSYSVLAENVPTLLPRTDYLVFAGDSREGGSAEHTFVLFSEVERIVGEGFFTIEPETEPVRLRASSWPDPGQFSRLKMASADLTGSGEAAHGTQPPPQSK